MNNLDEYIRENIEYFFDYEKGYFIYRCDTPAVSFDSIRNGSVQASELGKTLGITPDFALLCEVDDYHVDEGSFGGYTQNLRFSMNLFDLEERKVIWSATATGEASRNFLDAYLRQGFVGVYIKNKTIC
ncbi:MAG: hypothetical protein P8171_23410 [Candidatus Thiodiazotropha sp.]